MPARGWACQVHAACARGTQCEEAALRWTAPAAICPLLELKVQQRIVGIPLLPYTQVLQWWTLYLPTKQHQDAEDMHLETGDSPWSGRRQWGRESTCHFSDMDWGPPASSGWPHGELSRGRAGRTAQREGGKERRWVPPAAEFPAFIGFNLPFPFLLLWKQTSRYFYTSFQWHVINREARILFDIV